MKVSAKIVIAVGRHLIGILFMYVCMYTPVYAHICACVCVNENSNSQNYLYVP